MVSHIDLSTIHAHNLMSPKDDSMKLHNNDKDEKIWQFVYRFQLSFYSHLQRFILKSL